MNTGISKIDKSKLPERIAEAEMLWARELFQTAAFVKAWTNWNGILLRRSETPMTPNRLAAIAFRWLISAVLTLWLFAPNAQAQSGSATSMTGVYNGTYTCKGGPSKLKVSLIGAPDDTLAGFFIIDLPNDGPRFTYKLTGKYAWGTHQFLLTAVPWGPNPPAGYTMARLGGTYNPGSDLLRGRVSSMFCSDFWGERNKSESPESIAAALAAAKPSSPSRATSATAMTSSMLRSRTGRRCAWWRKCR